MTCGAFSPNMWVIVFTYQRFASATNIFLIVDSLNMGSVMNARHVFW